MASKNMAGSTEQGFGLYALPRDVRDLNECYFYHTMDIPGHGTVQGEWDLRNSLDDYLGHFDFSGRRVLDVGAASGSLSFFAEQKGASEVVSFDLSEDYDWDWVPLHGENLQDKLSERRALLKRINDGYWLVHQATGSNARKVHGVVYDIPNAIGPVDVAIFGSILIHLRDPFLALQNGAKLAQEAMIVTEVSPWGRLASQFLRYPRFLPRAKAGGITDAWFRLPPLLIKEYLAILGFPNATITWADYRYRDQMKPLYTIVARR